MRNQQTFTTRRGAVSISSSSSWARNRNTVRHTPKTLGTISQSMILGAMALIIGMLYIAVSTDSTNYDYELSRVEGEIAELQAKKEDLEVAKARLTSVAKSATSEVAVVMENATVSGYAE